MNGVIAIYLIGLRLMPCVIAMLYIDKAIH